MSFNYIKSYPCWLTDPYIVSNTSENYDNDIVSNIQPLIEKLNQLSENLKKCEEKIKILEEKLEIKKQVELLDNNLLSNEDDFEQINLEEIER